MGSTYTPKYAVEINDGTRRTNYTAFSWDSKQHGQPNAANIEKYAMQYARSLEVGGCNEHISRHLGFIPYPTRVTVRFNKPEGEVVAEWKAGMFQVYS